MPGVPMAIAPAAQFAAEAEVHLMLVTAKRSGLVMNVPLPVEVAVAAVNVTKPTSGYDNVKVPVDVGLAPLAVILTVVPGLLVAMGVPLTLACLVPLPGFWYVVKKLTALAPAGR